MKSLFVQIKIKPSVCQILSRSKRMENVQHNSLSDLPLGSQRTVKKGNGGWGACHTNRGQKK